MTDVDLNLIRTFAAVVEEGSVTGAALRLRMSQPSVTQALNRLRRISGDQLFKREGRGVVPTRTALELYDQVGMMPARIDSAVLGVREFDPSEARLDFSIALTDLGQAVFLPQLVRELRVRAPWCGLDVVDLDVSTAAADLAAGRLDLAVSSSTLRGAVADEVLRCDRYCCVGSSEAFGEGEVDLEELKSRPRVSVRSASGHALLDELLTPAPEGSVRLSGFAAIPAVLAASELVAFVPQAVISGWSAGWELEVHVLPEPQFISPVRAHRADPSPSASAAWFAAWAVEVMRRV